MMKKAVRQDHTYIFWPPRLVHNWPNMAADAVFAIVLVLLFRAGAAEFNHFEAVVVPKDQ